jgi:hypothetical protein
MAIQNLQPLTSLISRQWGIELFRELSNWVKHIQKAWVHAEDTIINTAAIDMKYHNLIMHLHNMLPNGRFHAWVLHPVSSIAHKEVSEATIITSKSSKKKKIKEKKARWDIVQQHIYLQNDLRRNAIGQQLIQLSSNLKQPKV